MIRWYTASKNNASQTDMGMEDGRAAAGKPADRYLPPDGLFFRAAKVQGCGASLAAWNPRP